MVRWAVFLAAVAFLYQRLLADQSTYAGWSGGAGPLAKASTWFWPAVLVLSALNWGVEAVKWRWLVAPLEPMPLRRAFAATLAGTSAGLVTPNRTGEPVGRALFLSPGNRWKGGFAAVLGSMAQLVATLVLGLAALICWWAAPAMPRMHWEAAAVLALAVLAGGVLLLYFKPGWLRRLVRLLPLLRRLDRHAAALEAHPPARLRGVLWLSMARYTVFWAQYVLFLLVFTGVAWPGAVLTVPLVFLATTLVPGMVLTDLGVRGSVAVALLGHFGAAPAWVLAASFGVWAVNLALPAAVGAVILLTARIRIRS